MYMVLIEWNRLIHRRQFGVDDQMMVTGFLEFHARGGDADIPRNESDPELSAIDNLRI